MVCIAVLNEMRVGWLLRSYVCLLACFVRLFVSLLAGWLITWSVSRGGTLVVGLRDAWLVGCLLGCLVGWLVSWLEIGRASCRERV